MSGDLGASCPPDATAGATATERFVALVQQVGTHLAVDPASVGAPVRALVEPSVTASERHPVWPSPLSDGAAPVELSVKHDGDRTSVRCVCDATDHTTGLAANWPRYRQVSAAVLGVAGHPADGAEGLLRLHLSGLPESYPSRLVHGLGFAGPDLVRASLYFRTGWMSPALLEERVPDLVGAGRRAEQEVGTPWHRSVEVVGYDFDATGQHAKAYGWLPADPAVPAAEVVGQHSGTAPARRLYEAFAHQVPPAARDRCAFLQTSMRQEELQQRVFFSTSAWRWDTPAGLSGLLGYLDAELGVDLRPLGLVQQAVRAQGFPLRFSQLAVGALGGAPSVTYYFVPAVAPAAELGARLEAAVRAGEAWLDEGGAGRTRSRPDLGDGVVQPGADGPGERAGGGAVPQEPLALARWLAGWGRDGGRRPTPTLRRVLEALLDAQGHDGGWCERRSRDEPVPDRAEAGTTAAVLAALRPAQLLLGRRD